MTPSGLTGLPNSKRIFRIVLNYCIMRLATVELETSLGINIIIVCFHLHNAMLHVNKYHNQ